MNESELESMRALGVVEEIKPPPASTARKSVDIYTVQELIDQARERTFSKAPARICTTGMWDLDDATGGIQPGFGWVLGADTNWGKSMMLTAIADENLRRGRNVLIVSVEDAPELYGRRLLARRSRVNAKRLRDRKLNPEEIQSVHDVLARAEKRVALLDARNMKAEEVSEAVASMLETHDIDLVMFDYLQEFRSSRRHQDRRNEVAEVAKLLRAPVKAAGRASIIASQITVDKTKAYPDKHSIRESRDVANAAEVVILGYRPAEDIPGGDGEEDIKAGTRCFFVDKVKDGANGFVLPLDWDDDSACFNQKPNPNERADNIMGKSWRYDNPDMPPIEEM